MVGTIGQPTEVIAGTGAVDRLAGVVAAFHPRRLLVVGGRTALARTEVARRLGGCHPSAFSCSAICFEVSCC